MNLSNAWQSRLSRSDIYYIRIGQHLDPECSDWLAGLAITNLEGGEAVLSGSLVDQAALYGVLQYLRDRNVPLIEIRRGEQFCTVGRIEFHH